MLDGSSVRDICYRLRVAAKKYYEENVHKLPFKPGPLLGLSSLDKADQSVDVQAQRWIIGAGALGVAAGGGEQGGFDVGDKRLKIIGSIIPFIEIFDILFFAIITPLKIIPNDFPSSQSHIHK